MKGRITIGQSMILIAVIALEFGILPGPIAAVAGLVTLGLTIVVPFLSSSLKWGFVFLGVIVFLGILLCLPVIITATDCSPQNECKSHLRQVSLALRQYQHTNGCYPPSVVTDRTGKPLYSWRVLILPYLDEIDLYNAYKLDEPWDSPTNLPLSSTHIKILTCPQDGATARGLTNYFAVIGPGTSFPVGRTTKQSDITDGLPNTIQVVDAVGLNVPWAKPFDLDARTMSFRINDPNRIGILTRHTAANVAMADGSIRALPLNSASQTLKVMLTINGGEDIGE